MTKTFKSILVLVVAFVLTLTLTGCGFASKAEKLEKQFNEGETLTLADVKDKMGDPTSDLTFANSGVVIWIEGCDTWEEAQTKWDEGETMGALVVTILANNVTGVKYVAEATESDAK